MAKITFYDEETGITIESIKPENLEDTINFEMSLPNLRFEEGIFEKDSICKSQLEYFSKESDFFRFYTFKEEKSDTFSSNGTFATCFFYPVDYSETTGIFEMRIHSLAFKVVNLEYYIASFVLMARVFGYNRVIFITNSDEEFSILKELGFKSFEGIESLNLKKAPETILSGYKTWFKQHIIYRLNKSVYGLELTL